MFRLKDSPLGVAVSLYCVVDLQICRCLPCTCFPWKCVICFSAALLLLCRWSVIDHFSVASFSDHRDHFHFYCVCLTNANYPVILCWLSNILTTLIVNWGWLIVSRCTLRMSPYSVDWLLHNTYIAFLLQSSPTGVWSRKNSGCL